LLGVLFYSSLIWGTAIKPVLAVKRPLLLSSPLRLPMNLGDPLCLVGVFAISGSFSYEVFIINFMVDDDFLRTSLNAFSLA
jgi:hypothetical protein